MKKVCLIGFLMAGILMMGSCDDDSPPVISVDPADLVGTWVRTYPNRVGGAAGSPIIERGETHIILTFKDNGEFLYNRTVLGLYEGTSIRDTSTIIIESGSYVADSGSIEVTLDKRIWWDSFYRDMEDFEESRVIPDRLRDVTFEIVDGRLNFIYYMLTDVFREEQEIPGLDKFDYFYTRR